MQKLVARLSIALGILEVVGAALCFQLSFMFESPTNEETFKLLVLLIAGPLTILPAGMLGRDHPMRAGVGLLVCALFCILWYLGVMSPHGSWLPILLTSVPMSLLGSAFVLASKTRETPAKQSPGSGIQGRLRWLRADRHRRN